MKVFISADMEGVAGVVGREHAWRDGIEFERSCKLMTHEVNAAIEGVLEVNKSAVVVVNDSHWNMRNILPEELHEAAELIMGSPKPMAMMQGIDPSFDVAFFVGYHAKIGTYSGVLEHTFWPNVSEVIINKKPIGEIGINAAVAGYFKVPVALVTGDQAVTEEARSLLENIRTVKVKEGVGRYAARCVSPSKAQKLIREAASKALKNLRQFKSYQVKPPIELEIVFVNTGVTQMAELVPTVKRTNGRTLTFTSNDYLEAFKAMNAMIKLAATTD